MPGLEQAEAFAGPEGGRAVLRTIIGLLLATLTLAGCEAASAPPGQPGSATVYLHGRVQAGIGTFSR